MQDYQLRDKYQEFAWELKKTLIKAKIDKTQKIARVGNMMIETKRFIT